MNDNDLLSGSDPEEIPQSRAERAFNEAAAPMWKDRLLRPFSGRRLIAAQSCGLRIFKLAAEIDPVQQAARKEELLKLDIPELQRRCEAIGIDFAEFTSVDDYAERLSQGVGVYDGIFWDAVITVYLCSTANSETLIAVRKPEIVCERALAWADAQNLSPDSPQFEELIQIFGSLIEQIMSSVTEPVDEKGAASPSTEKKMTASSPGSPSSPSRSGTSPEAMHPTSS